MFSSIFKKDKEKKPTPPSAILGIPENVEINNRIKTINSSQWIESIQQIKRVIWPDKSDAINLTHTELTIFKTIYPGVKKVLDNYFITIEGDLIDKHSIESFMENNRITNPRTRLPLIENDIEKYLAWINFKDNVIRLSGGYIYSPEQYVAQCMAKNKLFHPQNDALSQKELDVISQLTAPLFASMTIAKTTISVMATLKENKMEIAWPPQLVLFTNDQRKNFEKETMALLKSIHEEKKRNFLSKYQEDEEAIILADKTKKTNTIRKSPEERTQEQLDKGVTLQVKLPCLPHHNLIITENQLTNVASREILKASISTSELLSLYPCILEKEKIDFLLYYLEGDYDYLADRLSGLSKANIKQEHIAELIKNSQLQEEKFTKILLCLFYGINDWSDITNEELFEEIDDDFDPSLYFITTRVREKSLENGSKEQHYIISLANQLAQLEATQSGEIISDIPCFNFNISDIEKIMAYEPIATLIAEQTKKRIEEYQNGIPDELYNALDALQEGLSDRSEMGTWGIQTGKDNNGFAIAEQARITFIDFEEKFRIKNPIVYRAALQLKFKSGNAIKTLKNLVDELRSQTNCFHNLASQIRLFLKEVKKYEDDYQPSGNRLAR